MKYRDRYILGLIVVAIAIVASFWVYSSLAKQEKYSQVSVRDDNDLEASQAEEALDEASDTSMFSVGDYNYEIASIDNLLEDENVESSISLDDIISGGVGKDGIPSIQEPRLATVAQVPDWMNPSGDGLVVQRDGQARFYPYQVLVGHEIVNDELAGYPLLVTYCPLCFTGVVYDPTIDGDVIAFGVSGKLWESNLLMYNRSNPESLWSQALGQAVVGPATGRELEVVRFDITTYEKFASSFPDGSVLIGDAEISDGSLFARSYARIPYGGDLRDIDPFFPFSGDDARLSKTDIILGIVQNDEAKAYLVSAIERDGEISDTVGGQEITIFYNENSGVAEFYSGTINDGQRLSPIPSFWISWVSVHPDTLLYK